MDAEGALIVPSIYANNAFAVTISALLVALPVIAQAAEKTTQQRLPTPNLIASSVHEAAQRFGIPERWIGAVLSVESGGNVAAISRAGAIGLMQVMPQTYAALRTKLGLGADPYVPRDNIIAGAAYLRKMHDSYGDVGFLAAYNAGPRRWEDYLAGVRPLPRETIRYMARLAPQLDEDSPQLRSGSGEEMVVRPEAAPIFVSVSSTIAPSGRALASMPSIQPDATPASTRRQKKVLPGANFHAALSMLEEQRATPAPTLFASRPTPEARNSAIASVAASPLFVPRTIGK